MNGPLARLPLLAPTRSKRASSWDRTGGNDNWYGEGDDMIFVDGEPFPPSLHGTGTEDYVRAAWCPATAYWYQAEPHGPFPVLPPVAARLPGA